MHNIKNRSNNDCSGWVEVDSMPIAGPRDKKQLVVDRYLMLHALKLSEGGRWLGATKVQKIIFYSEYLMNKKSMRAFSLLFRKFRFGPYSDDLSNDIKEMSSFGLVEVGRGGGLALGDLGRKIMDDTTDFNVDYSWILPPMIESANKIAPMTTEETLEFIYALPLRTRYGTTVGVIPDGAEISRPLDPSPNVRSLSLKEEWLETLAMIADMDVAERLEYLLQTSSQKSISPFVVN